MRDFSSAISLIIASLKLFTQRIWKFIYIFVLFFLLLFIAVAFLFIPAFVSRESSVSSIILKSSIVWLLILSIILVFFGNIVFLQITADKNMKVSEAFRQLFLKIIPCLKTFMAYIFIIFAIFSPLLILGMMQVFMNASFPLNSSLAMMPVIVNLLVNIISSIVLIFLIPVSMLIYVLRNFLFFPVIIDNKPVIEGITYVYKMARSNFKVILWRVLVFAVFYIIVLSSLGVFSQINPAAKALSKLGVLALEIWMMIFSYAMYDNLKMLDNFTIDSKDIGTIKKTIKIGAAAFVLLAAFCVLDIAVLRPGVITKDINSQLKPQDNAIPKTAGID